MRIKLAVHVVAASLAIFEGVLALAIPAMAYPPSDTTASTILDGTGMMCDKHGNQTGTTMAEDWK